MNLPIYHEEYLRVVDFVVGKHKDQYRKRVIGGTLLPYVFHPFDVASLVWKWGAGNVVNFKASLAHDVREDCGVSRSELIEIIGKESADIVEELSFIPDESLPKSVVSALKAEYMGSFKGKSVSALVIKIADRICNTLDYKLTDPDYAVTYWHKADALFEAYEDRFQEVGASYGEQTVHNIDSKINDVKRIIGS